MKLNKTISAGAFSPAQWPHEQKSSSPDQHVTRIEKHGTGPVETGEEGDNGEE